MTVDADMINSMVRINYDFSWCWGLFWRFNFVKRVWEGRTKIVMMTNYLGAAIATGCSLALLYILNFLFAYRVAKVQPFRLSYLKIIIVSLIAVFVVYLLTKYVIGVSTFALIAMLFVFLALYFFLLLLMKSFEEEDLMIMRAIDQKLGTKSNWIREIIKRFL
jgi:hypothetical protein